MNIPMLAEIFVLASFTKKSAVARKMEQSSAYGSQRVIIVMEL
jgi:hypothetical protein